MDYRGILKDLVLFGEISRNLGEKIALALFQIEDTIMELSDLSHSSLCFDLLFKVGWFKNFIMLLCENK